MQYYAHTPNQNGKWHYLEEHLRAVATRAKQFADNFEAGELGYYAGLWHDLGKFSPQFQQYLEDCHKYGKGTKVDHKAAGTLLMGNHKLRYLKLLIQGHHGGLRTLPNCDNWMAEKLNDPTEKAVLEKALEDAKKLMPDLEPSQPLSFPTYLDKNPLVAEFFIRMLFSALVDADFLDTERHFSSNEANKRVISSDMVKLWELFEANQLEFQAKASAKDNTLYQTRQAIYQACVQAGKQPRGFFRLTVPTGGGKTRSGMAFALNHALEHKLERIIVAVPFTTITEQTASVYRTIFDAIGDEVVLEHHNAFLDPAEAEDEEGNFQPGKVWSRLAAENWDAPIIVTTTVQLLESLFANSTRHCRKLHNLAKSVIIIDEAQALPPKLLSTILDGLTQLCKNYGSSVVISTATQPAFEFIKEFKDIAAFEIVQDYASHFEALKRVEYTWLLDQPHTWAEVAGLMFDEPSRQVLAVVNTKKDARALLNALGIESEPLYFSTDLCALHRQAVLAKIKQCLLKNEPCLLVSTQAIEAGVDLDFPVVLRALAPLDSIIQAAGRCNQEGKPQLGKVIVFEPIDGSLPYSTEYKIGTSLTRRIFNMGKLDANKLNTLQLYFTELLKELGTDRRNIQPLREKLNYPEVAKTFRLIEDDTQTVVVLYGKGEAEEQKIKDIITKLRRGTPNARLLLRQLQPFTLSIQSYLIAKYKSQKLIDPDPIANGLHLWIGDYHETYGIETGDVISPDKLVV